MSCDLPHSDLPAALLTCVLAAAGFLGPPALGSEAPGSETFTDRDPPRTEQRLEAPPAASGRPDPEELEAHLRPQHYPGLPSVDPFDQDPEQLREALRLDVQQALAAAPELADASILVRVSSLRRVRLSGVVEDDSTRILAEVIAAGVTGISGVDNGLRIEAAPQ